MNDWWGGEDGYRDSEEEMEERRKRSKKPKAKPPLSIPSAYIVLQTFTEAGVPLSVIQFIPGPLPKGIAPAIRRRSFGDSRPEDEDEYDHMDGLVIPSGLLESQASSGTAAKAHSSDIQNDVVSIPALPSPAPSHTLTLPYSLSSASILQAWFVTGNLGGIPNGATYASGSEDDTICFGLWQGQNGDASQGSREGPGPRDYLRNGDREETVCHTKFNHCHLRLLETCVHVARNIEEVIEYLGLKGSRLVYGEPVSEVFKRRTPWFAECSSHRFINHVEAFAEGKMVVDPADTKRGVRQEVACFFNHITGVLVNPSQNLTPGRCSYFLSLTYPDIMLALPAIEDLSAGVDALEVRVDLLRSKEEVDPQG
ncbi:hypothetical protein F5878DRAFT_695566, partial [Lentinula raphanica]